MTDTTTTINSAEPGITPGSAEPVAPPFDCAQVQLPALPNLSAQQVELCAPWKEPPPADRQGFRSKQDYKAYSTKPETHDRFISGIVGEIAAQRVRKDNPPAKQVAIVADYDTKGFSDERVQQVLGMLGERNAPNFISRSFSGGIRAVWLLEEPLPLANDTELAKRLLELEMTELNLSDIFGPVDATAFKNPGQYYHQGWGWEPCNPRPISKERSRLWLSKAIGSGKRRVGSIPIGRIAEEVKKRFPGRWRGEFAIGARGKRFWDSAADNDSAAIVTAEGMACFTGTRPFMSWTAIFGPNFAKEWEESTMGMALCDTYFCADKFYVYCERTASNGTLVKEWQRMNRQSVESLLHAKYGLRKRTNKDDEASEVVRAVGLIIEQNSVNGVAPILYQTDRVLMLKGKSVLNTSFTQVLQPDLSKGKTWGDGFPWIAAFLEQLLPDEQARLHFLCEWAHAYANAYHHKPRNGHILFVAGEVGTGKNFMSEVLFGPSLGGFSDASDYLLGRAKFNEHLFDAGAWVCNDSVASFDYKGRRTFAANLKKQAANQEHVCEGKFKNAVPIPWQGRVLITLNTDPFSLELLPQTDASNKDKMAFFRTSDVRLKDAAAAFDKAKAELPALCAYLLNFRIPDELADPRWGVVAYHDASLLQEAVDGSATGSVAEIMATFLTSAFAADGKCDAVEGLASEWLQMMSPEQRQMARELGSAYAFGRALRALVQNGDFPMREKRLARGRIYSVERQAFEEYCNRSVCEDGDDKL